MAETQKEKIMRCLHCTEEEAEDIIKCDKIIDKGKERLPFDLTKEEEKLAMKLANVGERKAPPNYQFKKRERKANPTKSGIIAELAEFLGEESANAIENVIIVNAERQISFSLGENDYELTLVQKRKKK